MRKLALFLSRPSRAVVRELRQAQQTIDRLEIAVRRLTLKHNELATDLERLSDRLCATQGRLLGGKTRKPSPQAELDLDAIPHGDKRALRAYFKTNPPAKTPDDETEH